MGESKTLDMSPSPHDSEKGAESITKAPTHGDGVISDTGREDDFMTRNGLNLKSFRRRELPPLQSASLTSYGHPANNWQKVTGERAPPNLTAP